MSLLVLLILAVVWGVFLVPQVLRARADRGPADSIGSFRNQLSMIERSLPDGSSRPVRRTGSAASAQVAAFPYVPPAYGAAVAVGQASSYGSAAPSKSELQRRRQNVLLVLLALVVGTLALGLLFPPAFALNVVVDLVFAGYVALLVRARAIAAERDVKVRYLPGPMAAAAVPVSRSAERTLRTVAR